MALQRHRSEVGKKSKIKKILKDQPLKKEREKIGLTEKEKKKAIRKGKGKRAAKKTKEFLKKAGTSFKEGFVVTPVITPFPRASSISVRFAVSKNNFIIPTPLCVYNSDHLLQYESPNHRLLLNIRLSHNS